MRTSAARRALALGLLVVGITVTGCQPGAAPTGAPPTGSQPTGSPSTPPAASPSGEPAPSAAADGPEGLIAALQAAGANPKLGQVFAADPFVAQGFVVCLGAEQVRMYVFDSIGQRTVAMNSIDRDDPSSVGTAMVSWNGRPRFWARDRLLLLYLGEDAATDTLLRGVLGEPFASGQGRQLLPDDSCH